MTRVLILGGGFGGAYAAMELERRLEGRDDVEVALVNRENYLAFQPLLAEVVAGDVGIQDTVAPLRRLLPRTRLYVRSVASADVAARTVTLAPAITPELMELHWDRLVIALGSVANLRVRPGFAQHALPFRSLADAIRLRNHAIGVLEQAAIERDPALRRALLTFVVAGGGFSGTELAASLNDFLRRAAAAYRADIDPDELRVVLVHSGGHVLDREVPARLSRYATGVLRRRGVELALGVRATAATPEAVLLDDDRRIPARTFVSTVPSAPSPVVAELDLPRERGRLRCDAGLQVEGRDDVWALGDCALVPHADGRGTCPPTAQYAIRQATVVAHNVLAGIDGRPARSFTFTGLGKLGALGRRHAVAELPGGVRLSGLSAWLAWRAIYWSKLPGAERKLRVGASWLLDLLVDPEITQLELGGAGGVSRAHHEAGDVVFRQGQIGDRLYMIVSGRVQVVREDGSAGVPLAELGAGEYFGEMALLGPGVRGATVRCLEPTELITLPANDFGALVTGIPGLRKEFEDIVARRTGAAGAPPD